jgi:hypothetical protein
MVLFGHTKQAASAKTSLIYLTVGALTIVWTIIWYRYLNNNNAQPNTYLWAHGFLATGIVLVLIGLGVGQIGRSAMAAETAPAPAVAATTPGASVAAPGAAVVTPAAAVAPPAGAGQQAVAAGTVPASAVAPAQAARRT